MKNKNIVLFVLLIGCIVFVVALANNSLQEKEKCPDNIIPKNLYFLHGVILSDLDNSYSPFFQIQGSWADGKGIEKSLEYGDMIDTFFKDYEIPTILGDCVLGQKNGENVNYLYCVPKIYTSDKMLDKDGNILETNVKYKISLVLEPLGKVNWEGNWIASRFVNASGDYKIENPYPTNIFWKSKNVIINTRVVSAKCESIKD